MHASFSQQEIKYILLLAQISSHILESSELLLSYLDPYIFPVHLFIKKDFSHEATCVDTVNPPALRLFQVSLNLFVISSELRVTRVESRDTWESVKRIFNEYILLYPYRVGFLDIQLARGTNCYILRIGDSCFRITRQSHGSRNSGSIIDDQLYTPRHVEHLASDMPKVSAAVGDWLLGVGLVNGVGTLFLWRDGHCDRIRLSSCVVTEKSRLFCCDHRVFALTGAKANILGEVRCHVSEFDAQGFAESRHVPLSAYLQQVETAHDIFPAFFPLWAREGAVASVVSAAEFAHDTICLLKETGDIVCLDVNTMGTLYVGNIGRFEPVSAILMVSNPDIHVQFTEKGTNERKVLAFCLSDILRNS